MAIPDYESLMLPLLEEVRDGGDYRIRDVRERLVGRFDLSEEDLAALLPSGRTPVFNSRVHWAKTYLEKAGAVRAPARGVVQITDRGTTLLNEGHGRIDNAVLTRFPEFVEWKQRSQPSRRRKREVAAGPAALETSGDHRTPEETLEEGYEALREALEDELLAKVHDATPAFFERLVIDFLRRLGYGGASGFGEQLGRARDGGVDGVIWEDKLGLDYIYVQAKRWQGSVGRPDVQAFAGSLEGFRARKGVMITTSTFTDDARDYVERIEKRIVLIDGRQLARMMFDAGLGVATQRSYEVKALDSDYFDEDV